MNPHVSRGKLLTLLILVSALALGFDAVSFVLKGSWHANPARFVTYPGWYDAYYAVHLMVSIVVLLYLFMGKSWAVYVLFFKQIVTLSLDTVFRSWNPDYMGPEKIRMLYPDIALYNIWLIVLSLVFYALLAVTVMRRWEYFR